MKAGLGLVLGASALVLQGCAEPPVFRDTFSKAGVSKVAQERDSERCWDIAQTTGQAKADEAASQRALGAFIGGGIIGAVTAAAATDAENQDRKSPYKQLAHRECMAGKGYKLKIERLPPKAQTEPAK